MNKWLENQLTWKTYTAVITKGEWLEDILAGLMINGVTRNRIQIEEHPEHTVVRVDGMAKYRFVFTTEKRSTP